MALSINTNIASLQAQNALRLASEALARNQLRLSTGLRINSAADDAAGLSISKRMTAQIRGLNQAIRNAYDGISMMQTAEGKLEEMMNILQRMRELAVQASNALTDSDREDLNQEYQLKLQELDRIVDSAEFNGIRLLDGTAGKVTFQVGPNTTAANKIQVDLSTNLKSSSIGMTKEYGGTLKLKNGCNSVAIADGSLGVNGIRLNVSPYVTRRLNPNLRNTSSSSGPNTLGFYVIEKGHSKDSAYAIAQAINNSNAGVTAHAKTIYTSPKTALTKKITKTYTATTTGTFTYGIRAYGYYTLRINNFTVFSNYKVSVNKTTQVHLAKSSKVQITVTLKIGASTIAAAINKMAETLGVTAQVTEGGKLRLYNPDGGNIKITERAGTKSAVTNSIHTGKYTIHTFQNAFDGANGFFINQALNDGNKLIATAGFTGGNNDAFVNTIGGRTNIKTPARLTNANVTVIRGTVTITGPSAFKFTDYWETSETTHADKLHFSTIITSAGASVKIGKVDFTRLTNKTKNSNITTNAGNTGIDGIVYYFSAPAQQMFLNTTNILTVAAAQKAIERIDQAINDLNKFRAMLGATQNRFQSTINDLNNYVQKLIDARSRIVDADIAKESAEMVQNNIKRQAAAAILAQANQNPALALQLLGGM